VRRLVAFSSAVVLVETIFFSALAPLLPDFETELGLSKAEAGLLVSMYAIGGVCGAIPGGWASSRIGIRATAVIGLVLVAVTCVGFGLAET
jgi:MFS family permease